MISNDSKRFKEIQKVLSMLLLEVSWRMTGRNETGEANASESVIVFSMTQKAISAVNTPLHAEEVAFVVTSMESSRSGLNMVGNSWVLHDMAPS